MTTLIAYDGAPPELGLRNQEQPGTPKLRTREAEKVRCDEKHLETLGVTFKVATSADEA